MKTVVVLLSTYNGEKYLKEQLDSILEQDYQNIKLLIRDDGSTDHTVNILEEYADQYDNLNYYKGSNMGLVKSFFDLIEKADDTADYYCLSDQDDIWKKDKVSKAIEKLSQQDEDIPLLYCGSTELVDENRNPINSYHKNYHIRPGYGNALIENICTGCTAAFNKKLLKLIKKQIPKEVIIHDWWLYLVAAAFGKVIYDDQAYILYRQHQNNAIGLKTSYVQEIKKRAKQYRSNRYKISNQIMEFDRLFQVGGWKKELIDDLIIARTSLIKRLLLLFHKKLYRQSFIDNIIFKMILLLGNI